ncbi:MAG: MFS transporter, partial [Candidatus Eremiobacterota bacterium]
MRTRLRKLRAGRSFYALCAALVLSIAGLEMGLPFLPAYFEELGVRGESNLLWWSGLAQAVTFLASLACTPLWGRLGDRIGRKRMLVRAHLGLAAALALLSLARTPLEATLARIAHGALSGLAPAALALVAEGRRSKQRMAWVQSSLAAGAMLGPLAGALLLPHIGAARLYLIGAVLAALCASLVGWAAREAPRPVSGRSGPTRAMALAPF